MLLERETCEIHALTCSLESSGPLPWYNEFKIMMFDSSVPPL